jgi:hypothetical protein
MTGRARILQLRSRRLPWRESASALNVVRSSARHRTDAWEVPVSQRTQGSVPDEVCGQPLGLRRLPCAPAHPQHMSLRTTMCPGPRSSSPTTTMSTSDSGRRTPRADPECELRQFTVGTGGGSLYGGGAPWPNSEVRAAATFGCSCRASRGTATSASLSRRRGSRSATVVGASAVPDGAWRDRCHQVARSTSTECRSPGRSTAIRSVGRSPCRGASVQARGRLGRGRR